MRRFAPVAALLPLALAAAVGPPLAAAGTGGRTLNCDVQRFQIVERQSGKTDYYRVLNDGSGAFLRAEYPPPADTMVRGFPVPDGERRAYHALRWRWRALTLPAGGNECTKGKSDSAAAVYATWKRGLRWYTVKFVWSAGAPRGANCGRKSGIFAAQESVVLQSGGPVGEWREERIDLDAAFRQHFENGDPRAEVPDLIGVGVMTDGDQTKSPSAADYASFVLSES